jgi:hypothetical protein
MEGPVAFLSENTMLLWQININRRGVPKVFGSKTKKENQALRQATQGQQAQIQQMQQIIQECGAGDVLAARQALARAQHDQAQFVEQARIQRAAIDTDIAAAQRQLSDMQQEASKLSSSLIDLQSDVLMQDRGLFNFDNPAEDAIQLKAQLDDTKAQYKARVKAKTATHSVDGFTFNNSASKGKAFRSKMERMALRSYNAEAENAILTLKAGRLEAAEKRLQRACDQVNKLGEMISLHIDVDYHILRMRELRLTARYLEAKQQAKEAEREERARLREEARAEKELAAERAKLEKEKSKYEQVIQSLHDQGRDDEIGDLQDKIDEINRGLDDVDYRRANQRAGYVYVISNLGSFGERMVKIGMTRRLDPMDRVRELSDASVPFNFDVHLLHFSKDAVGVETALHQHFAAQKVNRINGRREFFYATPQDVRNVLENIDGSIVEYKIVPDAEQFRESEAIRASENPNVGGGRHSA